MGSGTTKKVLSALERITNLEQGFTSLFNGAQESLRMVDQRVGQIDELLAALVQVVGIDSVKDTLMANRRAQQESQVAAAKKAVEEALAMNQIVPLDRLPVVEELVAENETKQRRLDKELVKILVVGREYDADGNLAPPGRVQQPLSRILAGARALLAEKVVGDEVMLPEGRRFVLDELYIERTEPLPLDQPQPLDEASKTDEPS